MNKTKKIHAILAIAVAAIGINAAERNAHAQRFAPQIYSEGFARIEHNQEVIEKNAQKEEQKKEKNQKTSEKKKS